MNADGCWGQCELDGVLQDVTMEGHMKAFWVTMGQAFVQMLGHSYVSVVVTLVLLMLAILFVPVKVSRRKRIVIGFLHVSAHLTAAMILMLLLEICVETCVRHNLLGNTGTISGLTTMCQHCSHESQSSQAHLRTKDPSTCSHVGPLLCLCTQDLSFLWQVITLCTNGTIQRKANIFLTQLA